MPLSSQTDPERPTRRWKTARAQRPLLTVHILSSAGWFGAVVAFLAVTAVEVSNPRAAVRPLAALGWGALVPLSLVSLASGLALSLTGRWGLVRHWWVVAKLIINVVASVVLTVFLSDLPGELDPPVRPFVHVTGAAVLLVGATALAVWKPRGRTPWHPRNVETSS